MRPSLKIGAVVVAVIGLVMSGLAVARAIDDPGGSSAGRPRAEQVIDEALAPLVEDGTLTQRQVDAVVGELAPIVARARFQDRTKDLIVQLGRLASETAEVLGITSDELADQLESGLSLAEIASAHGSTGSGLVTQVTDHIAAHLAVQVTAGKLDPARAEAIAGATEKTLSELVDVAHPFGTVLKARRNRALQVAGLEAAADVIGLSVDEVRAQLAEGATLAGIARTHGVDEAALVNAMTAPAAGQIEQVVKQGRLTEAEADEALAKATQRVSEAIHRVPGTQDWRVSNGISLFTPPW